MRVMGAGGHGGAEGWLARNASLLGITASFVAAGLAGLYVGFLTTVPGANPLRLGWRNAVLLLALAFLLVQVAAARAERDTARGRRRSEGEEHAEVLLRGAVQMLRRRRGGAIYRAVVTVVEPDGHTRRTICGANISPDPDLRLRVPTGFGVSGRAFTTGAAHAADLTDADRDTAPNGSRVPGVWTSLACVLAFPLLTPDGRPFGTVNFDSDKPLAVSGLGNRDLQEALGRIVEVIAFLVRDHGARTAAPRSRWRRSARSVVVPG